MKDLNPTTRCYPRSLVDAFPTHYPESLELPPKQSHDWLFWVAVCLWVGIAYYFA